MHFKKEYLNQHFLCSERNAFVIVCVRMHMYVSVPVVDIYAGESVQF